MEEFKFKTQGLRDKCMSVSEIYFSIFLENKEGKKTEVTLSLILRFNLRLGATPYGARVLRAPYMIKISGA